MSNADLSGIYDEFDFRNFSDVMLWWQCKCRQEQSFFSFVDADETTASIKLKRKSTQKEYWVSFSKSVPLGGIYIPSNQLMVV